MKAKNENSPMCWITNLLAVSMICSANFAPKLEINRPKTVLLTADCSQSWKEKSFLLVCDARDSRNSTAGMSDDDAHKFDAVLLVQFLFTMPFGGDSNEARTCVG